MYHSQEEELVSNYYLMIIFYKIFVPNNNGHVPHVEMGSNRVFTMRVRGETNLRDTVLVCQLSSSTLPNSAEFCQISGFLLVLTIGASVVLNQLYT